jgi:hypothetical protein
MGFKIGTEVLEQWIVESPHFGIWMRPALALI